MMIKITLQGNATLEYPLSRYRLILDGNWVKIKRRDNKYTVWYSRNEVKWVIEDASQEA